MNVSEIIRFMEHTSNSALKEFITEGALVVGQAISLICPSKISLTLSALRKHTLNSAGLRKVCIPHVFLNFLVRTP